MTDKTPAKARATGEDVVLHPERSRLTSSTLRYSWAQPSGMEPMPAKLNSHLRSTVSRADNYANCTRFADSVHDWRTPGYWHLLHRVSTREPARYHLS